MRLLLLITFLYANQAFSQVSIYRDCQNFSAYCDCFPAIPLEGFKLHIVEICDGKEEWFTSYEAPTFETQIQCLEATKKDPVCLNL